MMVEAVPCPAVNAGAVAETSPRAASKISAVHRTGEMSDGGVSYRPAMRREMAAASTAEVATTPAATTATAVLRPNGHRKQNQAKRRYGQPAPHIAIITPF